MLLHPINCTESNSIVTATDELVVKLMGLGIFKTLFQYLSGVTEEIYEHLAG